MESLRNKDTPNENKEINFDINDLTELEEYREDYKAGQESKLL
jgi:hypothetical protein